MIILIVVIVLNFKYNSNMLLKDNVTGQKAIYKTKFSYHKFGELISFKFTAHHSKFFSYSNKYNDQIYNGDVCEVFLFYGEKDTYYEMEIAPNGTLFFAKILHNKEKHLIAPIDEEFIVGKVKRFNNLYKATITINIAKLNIKGNTLGINAFRIETDGGVANKHLFSLNPTMCTSFHTNCIFKVI